MAIITAEQIRGRATGALFFSLFGAAWLALWLAGTQHLTALTGSGVALGALALVLVGSWVLRQAKRMPPAPPSIEEQARQRHQSRVFNWVNAGQWASIVLLSWLLPRLGYGPYVTPAIAAVVGLHLFPLAHLFHNPVHYLTGAALLAWAGGCALLVRLPELPARTALGTGLMLWSSAGYALWLAVRSLRQV